MVICGRKLKQRRLEYILPGDLTYTVAQGCICFFFIVVCLFLFVLVNLLNGFYESAFMGLYKHMSETVYGRNLFWFRKGNGIRIVLLMNMSRYIGRMRHLCVLEVAFRVFVYFVYFTLLFKYIGHYK